MPKESYRSRDGKIVAKDITYTNKTVHEKRVPGGYKITGTTTHKGGKSTYQKKPA